MKASILLIVLLCACVVHSQEFGEVHPGVEFANFNKNIGDTNVRISLLRLDPKRVRLEIVHAGDSPLGLEKTSEIAKSKNAVAAINAGFFRLDTSDFGGEAAGLLQIDKQLISESFANRVALGIENKKNETKLVIGNAETKTVLKIGKETFSNVGFNRECKNNEIVIFTPGFRGNFDVKQEVYFFKKRKMTGFAKQLHNLSKDEFAVSGCGSFTTGVAEALKKSKKAQYKSTLKPEFAEDEKQFKESEDIVAGIPRLIRNGKIDVNWEKEKTTKSFSETKHPRTAIALLKSGRILLVAIDGRSESSGGISLDNLAKLLLELGAKDAMNLDGGGSTAMYLDGKIVNNPSDKDGERKISDAILVFLR
ncbi:MAG: phosphodiester glycosidase family protein [Pyrinomonadaceae bacterium]